MPTLLAQDTRLYPISRVTYLQPIKNELVKAWPTNRSINIIFHGHSVPVGYFNTPVVNTIGSYPHQFLKLLKVQYPNAVVNIIVTAIGGENSEQGAERFKVDVLPHKRDIFLLDYALNDTGIGLTKARQSWEYMIGLAQKANCKVILLTPSPDQRVDLTNPNNVLKQHADQIVNLANQYGTGLVNSYQLFEASLQKGQALSTLMSHVNHPNEAGHALISKELMHWFE